MKKSTIAAGLLIKALVGLGLMAYFLSDLDLSRFFVTLRSARMDYFLLALAAYLVGKLITAVRWALLARPLGFTNPLKDFALFYYIGMFFNLFAPSTLGGDAGRVFYLSRDTMEESPRSRSESAGLALISILADRAIGLVVLVWAGAAGLLLFPQYASLIPRSLRLATFALAAAPILGWALFPLGDRLAAKIDLPLAQKLRGVVQAYRSRQGVLLQSIGLSLAFHLIQLWIQLLAGHALGFDIPWSYALVFFPMVDILSMLPVSFSGIGLREGGYLFFLGRLGVGAEQAVACGTLWLAMLIASGLVGGVVFILNRGTTRIRPDRL
jgi:uncharacterized membrane protein YbhN (UPF0104 family)